MANMRLQGWWPDQGQRYRHVCLVVLLLWSVVSFAWTGSVQAKADGPAPLHQLAKTLEGEKTPPSSLLFYRRPLGFDLYTFETLLTPARAPADFLAALTAVVEEERQKLGGAGALFLEGFALVTLAGLSVRRRVTAGALARGVTLEARCPRSYRPLLAAGLRVAVATLIPLSLLLLFLLGRRTELRSSVSSVCWCSILPVVSLCSGAGRCSTSHATCSLWCGSSLCSR